MREYSKSRMRQLFGASALSGLFMVIASGQAAAQTEAAQGQGATVDEVVVTAARRAQDVTEIPYNITAVAAAQVARTGVATVEDLSRQVPNLVVTSSGSQFMGAQRQIMRGLNASGNRNGVSSPH